MDKGNKSLRPLKGGRKIKKDPSVYRYTVNLNAEENQKFRSMMEYAQTKNISKFITSIIFGKEIKVLKIDKNAVDYYKRLTDMYLQYQAIGVNYNQTVKAIKTNFAEKRALALLYKLEKATIELVRISKQFITLTQEFEDKYLNNQNHGSQD